MQAVRKALIAAASVGGMMAVLAASPASAAPITFTWNPAGTSGTALSTACTAVTCPPTGIPSISPQIKANNMTVADYATIDLTNLSHVTESGWLVVTAFALQGQPSAPGFVNGNGGGVAAAQIGATPYQLYFTFNSTSHLAPDGSGGLAGAFDTVTYSLMGDVGGLCTFSTSGPACGTDTQLTLATGSLDGGLNSVTINSGGIPAANADVTSAAGANAGSFFVSPTITSGFLFETAFTNTGGVVSRSGNVITINGGGGNVDILVPEPLTLSVFGAGLVGAAALRRKKAKKA